MLIREHFEIKETAVTIISRKEYIKVAKNAIFEVREIIENKIFEDPFFRMTYDPYPPSSTDDPIIQRMCAASVQANVGPMASVAGAVASYAAERMRDAGAEYAVVENGGDIAIICDRPVTVGLYTGSKSGISMMVQPTKDILGVCSSSGKIGPSVSMGDSDISTVISNDVVLADAAATMLGNLMKDNDASSALEKVSNIPGVEGCIVQYDGKIAMIGNIPELIGTEIPEHKITRVLFKN